MAVQLNRRWSYGMSDELHTTVAIMKRDAFCRWDMFGVVEAFVVWTYKAFKKCIALPIFTYLNYFLLVGIA